MNDDEKKAKNEGAVDYYVNEWEHERSLGFVVRETAGRTGLTLTETLLFFNYLERWALTNEMRRHSEWQDELRPLLMKHLKEGDDEGWKSPDSSNG